MNGLWQFYHVLPCQGVFRKVSDCFQKSLSSSLCKQKIACKTTFSLLDIFNSQILFLMETTVMVYHVYTVSHGPSLNRKLCCEVVWLSIASAQTCLHTRLKGKKTLDVYSAVTNIVHLCFKKYMFYMTLYSFPKQIIGNCTCRWSWMDLCDCECE